MPESIAKSRTSYSAVDLQQGRVPLDPDFNEEASIAEHDDKPPLQENPAIRPDANPVVHKPPQ